MISVNRWLFCVTLCVLVWLNSSFGQTKNQKGLSDDQLFGTTKHFIYPNRDIGDYGFNREQMTDTSSLEQIFKKVFDENSNRMTLRYQDIQRVRVTIMDEIATLGYITMFQGVPIEGTEVGITISRKTGRIIAFGARYFQSVKVPSSVPSITREAAERIAEKDCGSTDRIRSLQRAELMIIHSKIGDSLKFNLAWRYAAWIKWQFPGCITSTRQMGGF
jgi:Zn-dependent metalloprotease